MEFGATLGQAHAAGAAIEQARLQMVLQLNDLLADHGARELQTPGGRGEGTAFNDRAERSQAVEIVRVLPVSGLEETIRSVP